MPENGEKNNNRSNWPKSKFARTLFFYISVQLFCTTTMWNFQKLPGYTFYGGNIVHVPVHFFFTVAHFKLVFSLLLQNFVFSSRKMSPLFFLSRSSSLSLWDSLACHATFSFSISKIVDMTTLITLSLKL